MNRASATGTRNEVPGEGKVGALDCVRFVPRLPISRSPLGCSWRHV
jgi:hypothetical protein